MSGPNKICGGQSFKNFTWFILEITSFPKSFFNISNWIARIINQKRIKTENLKNF